MDRDLGAKISFPNEHLVDYADYATNPLSYDPSNPTSVNSLRVLQIRDSGGMHYQWGRKDPIPVFYNPGGFYNAYRSFNTYPVYRQTGNTNISIIYSAAINNANYESTYTKEFTQYSSINLNDSVENKIKKILKYSSNNPFIFLYNNTSKDWLSNENGLFKNRWGHANEKSVYDPCPAGWRIPDLQGVSNTGSNLFDGYLGFAKGNSPWFYNGKFNINNKAYYGIDPADINSFVNYENYNLNSMNYIGGYVRSLSRLSKTNVRYGFILNKPSYNVGLFPNNSTRGLVTGGNNLDVSFINSGLWTAAPVWDNSGKAFGALFNTNISVNGNKKLYFFTPSNAFTPQVGMSCRCAKIQYDANGKEIGRYEPDAIPVPQNATGKAINTYTQKQVDEIIKDDKKIIVFPNPVKNALYINADDKDYFYQIYNVSGQLVKQGKFENKQTNVSTLASGVYLIRINNAGSVVKIIKD